MGPTHPPDASKLPEKGRVNGLPTRSVIIPQRALGSQESTPATAPPAGSQAIETKGISGRLRLQHATQQINVLGKNAIVLPELINPLHGMHDRGVIATAKFAAYFG